MSANPYENEPGFEDANEPSDKKNQKDYVQKVYYTVRPRASPRR
jgi:ubiquitin-conjugating enzyme E2 Z